MTKGTWDIIAQIGITIFGILAIFLVARKNKWGFVFGLISQPFWFITAIVNEQWGVFALSIVYLANWIYGMYKWFQDDKKSAEKNQPSRTF